MTAILTFTATLHFLWGLALLLSPAAGGVTGIAMFQRLVGSEPSLAGVCYLLATICAVLAFGLPGKSVARLILLLPQQTLVLIAASGAIVAIWQGAFLDGASYPRGFIAPDQGPRVLLAAWHTWALLYCYLFVQDDRWTRRP